MRTKTLERSRNRRTGQEKAPHDLVCSESYTHPPKKKILILRSQKIYQNDPSVELIFDENPSVADILTIFCQILVTVSLPGQFKTNTTTIITIRSTLSTSSITSRHVASDLCQEVREHNEHIQWTFSKKKSKRNHWPRVKIPLNFLEL